MKRNILELTVDELKQALEDASLPGYRAKQLAEWVYRKGVTDPAKMTNLPGWIAEQFEILTSRVVDRAESKDGTTKLLLEYADGERIETVMIPTPSRATACLSTQAGCAMGCTFCASGLGGLARNLTAGEMLQQILHLQSETDRRITNVVFMGTGEPLANYDATLSAVRAIIDPDRFALSARHVTISTIGLPNRIRRLAKEDLPITLAISLHAPNDALRARLIPASRRIPLADVIAAAQEFYEARNREITLEYTLLAGVNDTNVCAEALASIANSLRCNVNLIRYNPVEALSYRSPSQLVVQDFANRLRKRGVRANIRRSRGRDTKAACGQLRHEDSG